MPIVCYRLCRGFILRALKKIQSTVLPVLLLILGLVLLQTRTLKAQQLYENYASARALGMGNAFVSLVDDEDSLFYNPAGIAKNGGVFWTVIDPRLSLSDISNLELSSDLEDSSTFGSALDKLYGEPILSQLGAKTALILPYFSMAYYIHGQTNIIAQNPANPTLNVEVIKDTGIAVGTAFPIAPIAQLGFVGKRIERAGSRQEWGAGVISDILGGGSSPDVIFDNLFNEGVGYALDMGMNISVPAPIQPTFSFVWKNIGDTKFTADVGEKVPPKDKQEIILGSAFMFDLDFAQLATTLDIKHLKDEDAHLGKKVHFGFELGLPLIDLRAGYHQGYFTYGAGVDLGIFRLDAATWATELGTYPGQFAARQYMVQATIRLGLDLGLAPAGDSRKSENSFSSRKSRVKQRR